MVQNKKKGAAQRTGASRASGTTQGTPGSSSTNSTRQNSSNKGNKGKDKGVEVSSGQGTKRAPRKGLKRVLIGAGALLIVLVVVASVALSLFAQRVDAKLSFDSQTQLAVRNVLTTPTAADDPYYVLLLGTDSRTPGDYTGRSDTIILARVDPKIPQATLLSIPRDTEIQLEGYGTQKINEAYARGQQAGAIQAVSKLCGVDIAHYVEINFEGVIDMVDTLGGVTVDVPVYTELWGVSIEAGKQTLNGEQALIFSRCRNYPTGDFQRVVNQRILIQAIAKKILSANPVDLPGLVEQLADCMKSDLSSLDAVSLLLKLRSMDADSMYMDTIPSYSNFHDGVSYVALQEPEFSEMMGRVQQGLSPKDPEASAE